MGAFAPSDYRLLLASLPFSGNERDSADCSVEALNLKEDLLRGIYAYSEWSFRSADIF